MIVDNIWSKGACGIEWKALLILKKTEHISDIISIDVELQNYYQHIISYFTSKHSRILLKLKAFSIIIRVAIEFWTLK